MTSKIKFTIGAGTAETDAKIATTVEAALAAMETGDVLPLFRTIRFESWSGFFKVMTPNRLAMLELISERGGVNSTRALSLALGRDYAAVHADVAALLQHGLLERDGTSLRCEIDIKSASMATA